MTRSDWPWGRSADADASSRRRRSNDQWAAGVTVNGPLTMVRGVRGDVNISHPQRSVYHLDRFTESPRPPSRQARQQPSKLLNPRYELVDFVGRDDELGRLEAWRDDDRPVSVLLVHGPGGQGKSRLARQFARISRSADWQVLQARHLDDPASAIATARATLPQEAAEPGRQGILLIVDYAERWPVRDLIALVADGWRQARRARILLLARPAGIWWQNLTHYIDHFDVPVRDVLLMPLGNKVDRYEMFRTACRSFGAALEVTTTGRVRLPAGFDGADFHQVLAVHMAALATVDAYAHGVEAPTDPARISAYLLRRESAYWHALHTRVHDPLPTDPRVMGRAVFTALLTRPLSDSEGRDAVNRVRLATTDEIAARILNDHAVCYPPVDLETVLEPLYPDRLGEDFLALSTPGHHHSSTYPPDPWTIEAATNLIGVEDGSGISLWVNSVLSVLIETAHRWPHVAAVHLLPLLRARPELLAGISSAALIRLQAISGVDVEILELVDSRLSSADRDVVEGMAIDLDAIHDGLAGEHADVTVDDQTELTHGDKGDDPQTQHWIIRIVTALIVGLVIAVLVNIPVGGAIALLVLGTFLIRYARRRSTVAKWRDPHAVERRTERRLRALERSGYRTLHARSVPSGGRDSDGRIDHLVVGPTGVHVIDSEGWDKRLSVVARSHQKLTLGPFDKRGRLDEIRWEAEQVGNLISARMGYVVPVSASLTIYGPVISWKVLMVRGVNVYAAERVRSYLRQQPKTLTPTEIETIFRAAELILPPG